VWESGAEWLSRGQELVHLAPGIHQGGLAVLEDKRGQARINVVAYVGRSWDMWDGVELEHAGAGAGTGACGQGRT
jgi:hypothetical protein